MLSQILTNAAIGAGVGLVVYLVLMGLASRIHYRLRPRGLAAWPLMLGGALVGAVYALVQRLG